MKRYLAPAYAVAVLVVGLPAASIFFPQALMFPYERTAGATRIYSETPIPDHIAQVVGQADRLVAHGGLYRPEVLRRPIFLTQGGWRWRVLWFDAASAFAQTRPFGENIVVNRSNVAADRVWNGSKVAGERMLSDVIAHERTHVLIRMRFGTMADKTYPAWVREGYCDYVAGSSSLSDRQAADLAARGQNPPALFYFQSRKRVEAALLRNGGSVSRLFAEARSGGA